MNPLIEQLHAYPFAKLRNLLSGVEHRDGLPPISLAVGEPQGKPPSFVLDALRNGLGRINAYPLVRGQAELREAIAQWISRRYSISVGIVDPEAMILPLQGTREGLFAIAQVIVNAMSPGMDSAEPPLVIMPSPFYQIYEGAAILAGAKPLYLPSLAANDFAIDFSAISERQWQRCQLLYLCNPSNPTGAVLPVGDYLRLIDLADQHDFVIVSDECYSEIYADEQSPCTGLLEACYTSGRHRFSRCLVFNSLSKRSNLAGLRSGFVMGDPDLISTFLKYRTYHGSAMPFHHQAASIAAWNDEAHVITNRALYREKLHAVVNILAPVVEVSVPQGGFCLWAKAPQDDQVFARELYAAKHVTTLPGSFLARNVDGLNPGKYYLRMALVQPLASCVEAAERIRDFLLA